LSDRRDRSTRSIARLRALAEYDLSAARGLSSKRLEASAATSPNAIITLDAKGHITAWNNGAVATDQAIVVSLIDLARQLGQFLAAHGCGMGQGFYFVKPSPPDLFAEQCFTRPTALRA
jgi:hypothetical protein